MGFFASLNPNKLVDKVSKGLDKMVLTKEERMEHFPKLLSMYEPFKLIQRHIVYIVIPPYMLCWIAAFMADFITGVDLTDHQMELLNGDVKYAFIIICTFFFGGGMIESFNRGGKKGG